jgi:hypothetical protein
MNRIFIRFKIPVLLVFSLFFSFKPQQKGLQQHSVSEFGAVPDDGRNDAESLRKAMLFCKNHPGTILKFEPGVYDFRDEKAVELMEGILNGRVRGNPQDSIFRPYYPYSKGLDFNGQENTVVEADGVILLCDGWMEPVSLNNCRNIKISGLTIDYKVKPHVEGTITSVGPGWFEVKADSLYRFTEKMPLCRVHFYNNQSNRLLSHECGFPKFEFISPQVIRISDRVTSDMVGCRIMSPQTFHFRPAILILEAKDIELKNITVHSHPGMGIVGHRSENILLDGLRIVPVPGQRMSTNTDATHFTSCKGFIHYYNCQFEGQGDDAVNIHNYYMTIQKPDKEAGYRLVLKGADWHAQVLDYPDVTDTMELVSKKTLEVAKKVVVKTVRNSVPGLYSLVSFNTELPSDVGNYYLIDVTRLPKVEIIGCSVTANRARGFLIKTRNVIIENNLIRETTGTGIHVGAEGNWCEGPASENIIIRHNRIIRCGTSAGTIDKACGIAVSVEAEKADVAGLHKHILIEGNIIEGENAENGISISGSKDVIIRYNEVSGCRHPLNVRYSTDVSADANSWK